MIETKEQTRTIAETVVTKRTCDLCGAVMRADLYVVEEVTISAEVGHHYPEGGATALTEIDCCMVCWEARVVPALQELGATFRETRREL